VGRPHQRGRVALARAFQRARLASPAKSQSRLILNQIPCTDRKSLLLGTALASTLVLISVLTPTPAAAVYVHPASLSEPDQ
jgi:hypothetical protein